MWSQTQASIEKMAGWLGNLATTVSGGKIANIANASPEEARPVDPKLPTNEQGHSANIPARQRSEHEERAYQIKVSYVNDVQLIYAATWATGKKESPQKVGDGMVSFQTTWWIPPLSSQIGFPPVLFSKFILSLKLPLLCRNKPA